MKTPTEIQPTKKPTVAAKPRKAGKRTGRGTPSPEVAAMHAVESGEAARVYQVVPLETDAQARANNASDDDRVPITGVNQGEGNIVADRHYRDGVRDFVRTGRVGEEADEAMRAIDSPEGQLLRAAERIGESHSAGDEREDNTLESELKPEWWGELHTSGWDRVKAAFERDWVQTRADLGLGGGAELGQSVTHTFKQAVGREIVPPLLEHEPLAWDDARHALRFGYGAGLTCEDCDDPPSSFTIGRLANEWNGLGTSIEWELARPLVLRGYAIASRGHG